MADTGGVQPYSAYGFTGGNALLTNTKVQLNAAPVYITGAMAQKNGSSGDCFLLCYDALAADVTVGTTIPKYVIPITVSAALNFQPTKVLQFITALTVAMVMTDPKGTTAPSVPFGIDIYRN